jgi:putative redox protein
MSEVRLSWSGEGLSFDGRTSYGAPIILGAHDEGQAAKASDLLPLSLAACTAYEVVVILQKQRQDLRSLEAIVNSTQDPEPPWRFRSIDIDWVVGGTVDLRKAERAVALSEQKYCAIAATISGVVELTHHVRIEPALSR